MFYLENESKNRLKADENITFVFLFYDFFVFYYSSKGVLYIQITDSHNWLLLSVFFCYFDFKMKAAVLCVVAQGS